MRNIHWVYLIIFAIVGVWSGIDAYEPWLWVLEAGICMVALAILVYSFNKFPLSNLTYSFILLHCIILFVGAHYSYSRVPIFDSIQEYLGQERNNFDKLGHFAQGFVPAMVAREILIRQNIVNKKNWTSFFIICIALAISAFYELIEWWVAILSQSGAEDFLGTQGYEWDTQSDIFLALIGAITMLLLFCKWQDKSMKKLREEKEN